MKRKAHFLYIFYFTVVSMLIMPLLHLPIYLFNIPTLLAGNSEYILQELTMIFLFTGFPLLTLFMVYKLAKMIKNQYIFFLLSFIIVGTVSYFNFTTQFILTDTKNALKLFAVGIVLGLYASFALTYFWKRIFLLKRETESNLLKIPLIVIASVLSIAWVMTFIFNIDILLEIYIMIGEFLKSLGLNIFYIDYYGFIGVFLSLLAATISLIMIRLKNGIISEQHQI